MSCFMSRKVAHPGKLKNFVSNDIIIKEKNNAFLLYYKNSGLRIPVRHIVLSNSLLNNFKTLNTPFSPSHAKPQRADRPTKTILAPSARAMKISVPFVMPPSK